MKFTLSWLQEHLQSDASLDVIVDKLTSLGLDVEELVDPATQFANFEVAEIIALAPHPNADKLQLCTVKTSAGEQQLVCGAPNVRVGLKGVLAQQGAIIPSTGQALKKAKIRGVESNGMLCSPAELQLSDEHDGIIELDDDAPIGGSVASLLGSDDPMIKIEVTPNRADCLGVRGIARDLAASGLGRLRPRKIEPLPEATDGATDGAVDAEIGHQLAVASESCPYFTACIIENVTNCASPDWLQQRLRAIGLNPVSALVDITNYIAYDCGQPMHVYDGDKLNGAVVARQAKQGEKFTALDGNEYELMAEDCVIADEAGVLGLGGVMGGLDSGSRDDTKNIFVECAWFAPVPIALSGRRHNIESDARYRYERGVDPQGVDDALALAVQMMTDICGGTIKTRLVAGQPPAPAKAIAFDPKLVAQLGGLTLADDKKQEILEALGFEVQGFANEADEIWQVCAPSWRQDIVGAPDLVEEIARLYGLDNLPAVPLPPRHAVTRSVLTLAQRRTSLMRRALAGRGLVEAVTWSFIGQAEADLFGVAEGLELENPISSELATMRPSLLPNLLAAVLRNVDRGFNDVALFELGHEFLAATPGAQRLAASGVRRGNMRPRHWQGAAKPVTAFDVRADAQAALAMCGVDPASLRIMPLEGRIYHPGRAGLLVRDPKHPLAAFGELHPSIINHFGLSGAGAVAAFEIWPENIPHPKAHSDKTSGRHTKPALMLHNLQAVTRDFAFEMPHEVAAQVAVRAARGADKKHITNVRVFDLYEGDKLAEGMKSLALEVTLQPIEATLTDAEIAAISEKITKIVEQATGGKLRRE